MKIDFESIAFTNLFAVNPKNGSSWYLLLLPPPRAQAPAAPLFFLLFLSFSASYYPPSRSPVSRHVVFNHPHGRPRPLPCPCSWSPSRKGSPLLLKKMKKNSILFVVRKRGSTIWYISLTRRRRMGQIQG